MVPTGRVDGEDRLEGHGGGGPAKLARLAALLSGGKPPHPNYLTKREMESLTAICDTLLPSVDISGDTEDEELRTFYRTSASMTGTLDHMGGMLSGRLKHPATVLLRVALWFLSTWYGTVVMCGLRRSMSPEFPHLPRRFSQIEQRKREEILLGWSFSSFFLYQMLFKCLKFVAMRIHFQQADENSQNSTWKAIGYCGPDPELVDQSQRLKEAEQKKNCMGPIHRALIDMSDPPELIHHNIRASGFSCTTSSHQLTIRCDAVVVGSGSGGGVVAGVLAKAGYKVVVLEKGEYFPTSTLSLLEGPTTSQMYESDGLIATDDVGVLILAGATVGGGSIVNWSACIRTPDHVLNEWCDRHELKLFGGAGFQNALDAVCRRMGVAAPPPESSVEEGFSNTVLRRGCVELGYPVNRVPLNAPPEDHRCGWCHLGCKDGKKQSTPETWLADLSASGNGVILPGCTAMKVLTRRGDLRRNAASGVLAEFGTEQNRGVLVVESKVTVVACGALNTPGLLRRSGLRNPNIGRHLHLHPTVMAWGYFPEEEEKNNNVGPEQGKKSYEGGILTSMSTVAANFDTSGYGAVIQTPALHPGMFAVVTPWVSAVDFRQRMSRFSRTATLFALARDRGSGCSLNYPKSLSYTLDAADEENLKRGLEAMLRILAAAGAAEIGTERCTGERFVVKGSTGMELEEFVRKAAGRAVRDLSAPVSSAHQMGSCRMGVSPATSGVDPRGETWEVEGLFVADTSVFPTALGVNPMVTVQAVAYCTAQSVLEALRQKKTMHVM